MTTETKKPVDWNDEEQVAKQWFKWTVEIEVCGTWVADGFNLDQERAKSMIENELPHSYGNETRAHVIKSPDPQLIRKCQGGE